MIVFIRLTVSLMIVKDVPYLIIVNNDPLSNVKFFILFHISIYTIIP